LGKIGKISSSSSTLTDKVKMVRLLLDEGHSDPGLLNNDKKACYEVYNDQFGFDEAANIIEMRHLKGRDEKQD
jgi:hypothetical protein